MDDTQQIAQPTTTDSEQNQTVPTMGDLAGMAPQAPTMPGGMPTSVGDQSVTGMTPPPAVEPSMSSSPMPTDSMAATMPIAAMPEPAAMPQSSQPAMPEPTMSAAAPAAKGSASENGDDYSYAEDILSEILDSLDRIEAKLEAMEKKTA